MLVQRTCYQRRTFKFKLPPTFSLFEFYDLVTVADPTIGLPPTACRFTKISEDDDMNLTCEAEEFIYGLNAPTVQAAAGTTNNPNYTNAFPPSVADAAIFEMPAALKTTAAGLELGVAACNNDPTWGGCAVYISNDDSDYVLAGALNNTNTMGRTTTDYPSSPDPDTSDEFQVDLSESDGALTSATTAQQNMFASLAWLSDAAAGEFIAYGTVALASGDLWNLEPTIRRGVYSSTPADHPIGSQFVIIDSTILHVAVPQQWIGQTLYIKFLSFNTYQQNQQALADVSPITFVPTGSSLPPAVYTITPNAPVTQPAPGTLGEIVVAAFTAAFPTGVASYLGKTIGITPPVTTQQYWVTVLDPGQLGEGGGNPPLTYFADTTPTRANSPGYTYCGTIIATAAGGAAGTAGGSAGPR
jgi:hypothetical protein